ncbi:hypothetical protein ACOI1A_05600 [Corynebacterium glutamicum]|uniref:hypothetical protein n=1 Tax=Corynebacterium glutamicum TaxID=1718 RepID=UPI003B5A3AAF
MIPLGIIHQILQPGEALLPYAIVGLVILLPSSWLPRWAVAVLGEVSVACASGGFRWRVPAYPLNVPDRFSAR